MRTLLLPKRTLARGARFSILLFGLAGLLPNLIADDYERLEAATKRWLDLEEKIATERNAWKSQQKILAQTVLTLQADLEGLSSGLENLENEASARATSLAENEESLGDQDQARSFYEAKLLELTERLDRFRAGAPEFLTDELATAREKLDVADPAALGERAQILIAAFTRIEEFNRTVTIDYVPRELEDGREVMVSVLYWGLARGYAVDPQGTVAWELIPSADGWRWVERPDFVSETLEIVQIYEQTRPPSLQNLPGKVLNDAGGEG